MGRECSDCRENDKMFCMNMNYKCQNDNCENYIKIISDKPIVKYDDFKNKLILELLEKLFEKEKEILKLKEELWFLKE